MEFPVVQTDAGPVTLATVAEIQLRSSQWKEWATKAKQSAQEMRAQADEKLAQAGGVLVAQPTAWQVPAESQDAVQTAVTLAQQITADDQSVTALDQQRSSANIFGRIGLKHRESKVEQDRQSAAARLRELSIAIARAAPPTTLAQADELRSAAAQLDSQASAVDVEVQAAETRAAAYDAEVASRQQAIKAMGFDSLYEAATLQTSGAKPVSSPILTKPGEEAYVSVPATLARMVTHTQYVGGSSGFNFPIGHTGIRYRVGSFRGHPVSQQALTHVDQGTFVVTNQRLAYVGQTKSTSIPLIKILHVEVYDDGISVSREGKENPDWYLMSEAKHVVFLLNWVLSKHVAS